IEQPLQSAQSPRLSIGRLTRGRYRPRHAFLECLVGSVFTGCSGIGVARRGENLVRVLFLAAHATRPVDPRFPVSPLPIRAAERDPTIAESCLFGLDVLIATN